MRLSVSCRLKFGRKGNEMKNIKLQTIIVVVCTIVTVLTAGTAALGKIANNTDSIAIPPLQSGESYSVVLDDDGTCIELEVEMGLSRGDIISIENDNGVMTVNFAEGVKLDDNKIKKLKERTGKGLKEIKVKGK
jgi:hypothetical protein